MSQKKPRRTVVSSVGVGWKRAKPVDAVGTPSVFRGAPSVTLTAIVQTVGNVESGKLVTVLEPAWQAIVRELKANPNALSMFNPRQWEEIVAASYDKAGFEDVILTPQSGDLGRDIIATKYGHWSVRIVDQVKSYKQGHLVTANDVQALLGVLAGDPNSCKGVITTTSDFAPKIKEHPLIAPFLPHRLQLVNGEGLIQRISALSDGSAT